MAIMQVTMLSQCLMRTVPVTVIVPSDKMPTPGMPVREDKPYKTLYLLHGVLGSTMDWLVGTRIARFAEENDLAVVMPSGENRFYVDQPKGHDFYGGFIGEELVEQTRKMFNLSKKREDTFIGGLSMGGYGAFRNGLKYSETFGSIVALSSAFICDTVLERTNEAELFFERRDYAEACFGELDKLAGSDMDIKFLAKQIAAEGKQFPNIYMACGVDDSLLAENDSVAALLEELGANVIYKTGPGGHEWDFWDTYIKDAIYTWLPTEGNGLGFNSGNVGV